MRDERNETVINSSFLSFFFFLLILLLIVFCQLNLIFIPQLNESSQMVFSSFIPPTTNLPNYELIIKQNVEEKWYKARGNWITLFIQVKDSNNQVVTAIDQQIPLELKLFYELDHKNPVENKSILRIKDRDSLMIGNNAMATIEVRIEEISSKHHGQRFIIKVEPSIPLLVAPAFSLPIKVYSETAKRTHDNRQSKNKRSFAEIDEIPQQSLVGLFEPDQVF